MGRFLSLLSDPHRWSMNQACRIAHRGWLIERARTKRLRKQLGAARDHADFWRHEALIRLDDDPADVYGDDLPHSWEADQAAKGGE